MGLATGSTHLTRFSLDKYREALLMFKSATQLKLNSITKARYKKIF
jgi:hypothetical protein